jgi:hypothetical protein
VSSIIWCLFKMNYSYPELAPQLVRHTQAQLSSPEVLEQHAMDQSRLKGLIHVRRRRLGDLCFMCAEVDSLVRLPWQKLKKVNLGVRTGQHSLHFSNANLTLVSQGSKDGIPLLHWPSTQRFVCLWLLCRSCGHPRFWTNALQTSCGRSWR